MIEHISVYWPAYLWAYCAFVSAWGWLELHLEGEWDLEVASNVFGILGYLFFIVFGVMSGLMFGISLFARDSEVFKRLKKILEEERSFPCNR